MAAKPRENIEAWLEHRINESALERVLAQIRAENKPGKTPKPLKPLNMDVLIILVGELLAEQPDRENLKQKFLARFDRDWPKICHQHDASARSAGKKASSHRARSAEERADGT